MGLANTKSIVEMNQRAAPMRRRVYLNAATATVLLLALLLAYVTTLAPTITWKHWGIDTGELATAAHRWAVVHPPGYPLYLLLARPFTLLPFGEIAYRTNLMSAVFGVLTVLAAAWSLRLGLQGWAPLSRQNGEATRPSAIALIAATIAGAGMLAFAPTFWSQAVITEVYTLHTFTLALMVGLMLRWRSALREGSNGRRWLTATALVFGLGMANHTTTVMAIPGLLVFVALHHPGLRTGLKAHRMRNLRGVFTDAGLSMVVAAAPLGLYALVMLWARQGTWPSLWDPSSPQALLDHITGGPFRSLVMAMPDEWVRSRTSALPRLVLEEFGYVGFALAMAGVWAMVNRDPWLLAFGGLLSALSIPFAVSYPVYDSQVYLLPVYLFLAMAIGWGVALAISLLEGHRPEWVTHRRTALMLVVLVLPASAYLGNRPKVDVSQDREAYNLMLEALETVPPNGALICAGPPELFALWYLQYTEGHRRDVLVLDGFASRSGSYQSNLTRQFPGQVPVPGTSGYLDAFVRQGAATRAVYVTAKARDYVNGFVVEEQANGLFRVQLRPPPSAQP